LEDSNEDEDDKDGLLAVEERVLELVVKEVSPALVEEEVVVVAKEGFESDDLSIIFIIIIIVSRIN
jgi:hypothetical protein